MLRHLLSAVACVALAFPAPAETLTVGPPGSGADFASIGAAVSAAQPGDVILVAPGFYQDTQPLLIDKALTVIGAGSDLVHHATVAFAYQEPPALVVRDLGPGDRVRISGLAIATLLFGGSGFGHQAVVIQDCSGPVVLADVQSTTGLGFSGSESTCLITNSQDVLLDNCDFTAASGVPDPIRPSVGQAGLFIDRSSVHVNGCTVAGSDMALTLVFGPPRDGGPGIRAESATVRLSGSTVRGGPGAFETQLSPGAPGDGGQALTGANSQFYVRGGPGSLLAGGAGGGSRLGTGAYGNGGPAIFVAPDSLATSTPDAVLSAGRDGDGGSTTPAVSNQGTYLPLGEALAVLLTIDNTVPAGGNAGFVLAGEPGSAVLPVFSFGQIPSVALPGLLGVLVVDPTAFFRLPLQVLAGTGQATATVPVPNAPSLTGSSLILQLLSVGPAGTLSLSSPSLLAID